MIRVAWQGVIGFPLRTCLTALCLLVAVAGLVSVNAATETIKATVVQKALLANGPQHTFSASGLGGPAGLVRQDEVLQLLRDVFGSVSRSAQLQGLSVNTPTGAVSIDVNFVDPQLREIRPFPLVAGSWIGTQDWLAPRVCVNAAGARAVSMDESVVLRVQASGDSQKVVIGCVVEDGRAQPSMYADFEQFAGVIQLNPEAVTLSFLLRSPASTAESLKQRLVGWDSLAATQTEWDVKRIDTVDALQAEVDATRSTFAVVGGVGVLAAVLAIMNIGLSAIRERSSEFSIRRALGASRRQLVGLVLLESQIVSLAAGILAIPVSLALYPLTMSLFGAPFGVAQPEFPWVWAAIGVLVGMGAGLLGAIPAMARSFRIPIANVMRE
ncbi:MAG: transporter permease [Schumannella sp.]|nr:transporter permease [Schumannella sp.]